MQNDFSCHLGKHIVTCLLCWGNGANRLDLVSSRARRLEFLSMEGGVDKATGNGTLAISLLSTLLSAVEKKRSLQGRSGMLSRQMGHNGERYPVPEGISCAGDNA